MSIISKQIIIVDDDTLVLTALTIQLQNLLNNRYQYDTAESAEDAINIINNILKKDNHFIPLIITDYLLPKMSGSEMLIHLNNDLAETKKILLTGKADLDGIKMAIENVELFRYMQKPWEKNDLEITVNEALRLYYKEKQLRAQ